MGKKKDFFKRLLCFGSSVEYTEKSPKVKDIDDSSSSTYSRDSIDDEKYAIRAEALKKQPSATIPLEKVPIVTSPYHYGMKISLPHRKDKDPSDANVFFNHCKQKDYCRDWMVWFVKKGEILNDRQSEAPLHADKKKHSKCYDHSRASALYGVRRITIYACSSDVPPSRYDEKEVREVGKICYKICDVPAYLRKIHTRPNENGKPTQCHDITFKVTAVALEEKPDKLDFRIKVQEHHSGSLLVDTTETSALFAK